MRIILHIDLDSFYAAVEELRRPEIRGKPVVVCMYSGRTPDSGAVATANYPARALGIRAGLPIRTAKARATPETVFLPADRDHYRQVSDRVMAVLREHGDRFEQRSIDEAYLDVSSIRSVARAERLARRVKQAVQEKEGLTCTVGIGPNKLVAKMACRLQKPDGLTVVMDFDRVFADQPVSKLFGVGPKTLAILEQRGLKTIRDLARSSPDLLVQAFGERKGQLLHDHAHGKDDDPVTEVVKQQLSKIGTLKKDSADVQTVWETLSRLAAELHARVQKEGVTFRTVSILMIAHGQDRTRSVTLPAPTGAKQPLLDSARQLLTDYLAAYPEPVRRVGVRVSSFSGEQPKNADLRRYARA
ncbi:MAG: DNA polymerase IV [Candidatus Aenigmarchaeota archaeon]|nr:DNA polymerase IV [Candidatus Aenigmarchaeota archaeon]